MNLLYPKLRRRELLEYLRFAFIGSVIAAIYGIAHDQVTFTLSEEYFTKLKFRQFAYADLGLGPRVFAGSVGLLATWWVGFIAGWFLARLGSTDRAALWRGFAWIFGGGAAGGGGGFLIGRLTTVDGTPDGWSYIIRELEIERAADFIIVAYTHNGGYAGALVGFLVATFLIRRRISAATGEARGQCPDVR